MSYADSNGVKLYIEETGTGYPIVFVHEFAADHREWETQVRYFSRNYHCITYAARGYTPSDVPEDEAAYDMWATCDTENLASVRVLKKTGLSLEGTLRRSMIRPNLSEKPRDIFVFAKIQDDPA